MSRTLLLAIICIFIKCTDLFSQKEHFISLSNCGLIVGTDQSVFLRIIVERIGRSGISFILQFDEEFHKSLPHGNIGFRDIDLTRIIILRINRTVRVDLKTSRRTR